MSEAEKNWQIIATAAAALGVKPAARKKWRLRGVPHKWRLPIIQRTAGAVGPADLEAIGTATKKDGRHGGVTQ